MTDVFHLGPAEDDARIGRAVARVLLGEMAAIEPPPEAQAVARTALWAHARREPGAPVDFAVERALRTDPEAGRLYRRLLSIDAVAYSETAAAAYDNSATHRRIGDFDLDVVEEDDAPPTLIIQMLAGARTAPGTIEVVSIEGVVRLPLPAPVDGHIVMDLPRQDAQRDLLRLMLANPHAGVYLL